MAPTKYWRVRFKGDLTPDQVEAALPEGALGLLRFHKERGETHAYFSTTDRPGPGQIRSRTGESAEEVSLDSVTKIG
jgi:hypothetical protein